MKAISEGNGSFGRLAVTLTRAIIVAGCCIWAASTFAQALSVQSDANQAAQPAPADSVVQVVADSQGLQLVSPDQIPAFGTFWVISGTQSIVPWPIFPPINDPATTPVYSLGADGQFLVDATGGVVPQPTERRATMGVSSATLIQAQADAVANLITQVQTTVANQQMRATMQAMGMDVPTPGDGSGDSGTNTYMPDYSSYTVNYGSNLWVAGMSTLSGNLNGTATNTQSGVQYDIQSRTNLLQTDWQYEGTIVGSAATNWTPLSVSQNGRSSLFLRLRSNVSDGSGLPSWWLMQYFGVTGGIDPNALDPTGDGWSIWQDYVADYSPLAFRTPPAPQGVTVTYNASTGAANVSWQHSPGSVTGYTVNFNGTDYNVSASATNLTETLSTAYSDPVENGPTLFASFQVQADYAIENSAWSAPVRLESPDSEYSGILNVIPVYMFEGSQGTNYLAASVSMLPPGTVALRLTRADWYAEYWYDDLSNDTHWDIPVSTFTNNGLYQLPTSMTASSADAYGASLYRWWVQAEYANKPPSAAQLVSWGCYYDEQNHDLAMPPYFDGRAQLKQNLIFALRAATMDYPFSFNYGSYYSFAEPSGYAVADFFQSFYLTSGSMGFYGDVYWPFVENYLLRNFAFGLTNVDGGGALMTGANGDYYDSTLNLQDPLTYQFQVPANSGGNISPILGTNQTQWLAAWASFYPSDDSLGELGVTQSYDADWNMYFSLAANARNVYGLPFSSVKIAWGNTGGATSTLSAGSQVENVDGYFYPQTAQPQLHTVEYDFWQQYVDTLPGQSGFSTTNQSRLLITGVGQGFAPNVNGLAYLTIAGYAKMAVQNGYNGVYGYLQQYFDEAYQIDANGTVTTNTTGILSPYGDFFATQPGPAALVTMPDVDTGARGTCTVYSVSLVLDKNHDGNMDLSFSGADSTSPYSPFIFWSDQNFDRWATNKSPLAGFLYTDIEQDDQQIAFSPATPITPTPDCNYSNRLVNGYSYRAIPCTRDLEDFTRLWVCGITTNLIAVLPSGSTITLNWGDVGSPNPGNPTIDLFTAADADGGMGYLTNETIAAEQTNIFQCPYIGRLAPGGSIQLNTIQFANSWVGNHFIWCGVSNGTGGLNLTITDGNGNVLAQSTAYIQIVDIKQMYERWTVGDIPTNAPVAVPYLVSDNSPAGVLTFQYTRPTDTNTTYILHVHGFNMETWEKDRYAETEFKRLYWQGYQGRFGSFRWPTTFTSYAKTFDDSESNAWASAKGLLNLLTNLNAEYPGHIYLTAHSHGNVVAGEALRQATQQGLGQVVNTYVAMQGAVPSHAYDTNAPVRSLGILDSGTPNRYAHYYTDSSPCYFNGAAGAGTYVNFFNTNDWALTQLWEPDQDTKPDSGYGYNPVPGFFYRGDETTVLTFPTNTYELFSYCDEARCYAIGMQVNVGGAFTIARQVELDIPPYNFGSDHIYHSGEFRSDNPRRWQFWNAVLTQMRLK